MLALLSIVAIIVSFICISFLVSTNTTKNIGYNLDFDIKASHIAITSEINVEQILPLTYITCKEFDLSNSIQKMIYLFEPAKTRKINAVNINQKNINGTDSIPCLNTHKDCFKWSMENECELNPNYMQCL